MIKQYLDKYYSYTFKTIFNFCGQIDKIMGDGIIVMFSPLFNSKLSDKNSSDNAFCCSKMIIEEFYNTEYESKAAIGSGTLYYCKIGYPTNIYEEYTAVGKPLTIVYRLEANAKKNQILTLNRTKLSGRIKKSIDFNLNFLDWNFDVFYKELNGIGIENILISEFNV